MAAVIQIAKKMIRRSLRVCRSFPCLPALMSWKCNYFWYIFARRNNMDDSSTLKNATYFVIGIGVIIFGLGLAAYLYF